MYSKVTHYRNHGMGEIWDEDEQRAKMRARKDNHPTDFLSKQERAYVRHGRIEIPYWNKADVMRCCTEIIDALLALQKSGQDNNTESQFTFLCRAKATMVGLNTQLKMHTRSDDVKISDTTKSGV